MRAHEAIGQASPVEARDAPAEQIEELEAVLVIEVDMCAVDAARRNVEDAIGQVRAKHARHVPTVAP